MLNKNITTSEAIAILLHTAAAAGGFYLVSFILGMLVTSPLALLLALAFVNIINIIYYFSTLYPAVLNWIVAKVDQFRSYMNTKQWYVNTKAKISKATARVLNTKVVKSVIISAVVSFYFIKGKLVPVYDYVVGKIKAAKNWVVSKFRQTTTAVSARFVSTPVDAVVA